MESYQFTVRSTLDDSFDAYRKKKMLEQHLRRGR